MASTLKGAIALNYKIYHQCHLINVERITTNYQWYIKNEVFGVSYSYMKFLNLWARLLTGATEKDIIRNIRPTVYNGWPFTTDAWRLFYFLYWFVPPCVEGVSRAWRYCNTRTTRGSAEASLCAPPSYKNQINIIVTQCATNQILNWLEQILHFDLSQ